MRSKRLVALDKRIRDLRRAFLPRQFSPIGNYSPEALDNSSAFRLLVHAELESFIEEIALDIVNRATVNVNSGRICETSAAILCLYKQEMGGMPSQLSEINHSSFVQGVKLTCLHDLRRRIDKNNSIKPSSILSFFIPLGIDETKIDEQFLIDLSTLSARRGEVAHKRLGALLNLPDPKDDWNLVQRIVGSLKDFELLLPK